jgi:hypothetical protein
MDAHTTWRSYIQGPRWVATDKWLRNRIWADSDLKIKRWECDKGLVNMVVRFEVEGPVGSLQALQRDVVAAIAFGLWSGRREEGL